MGKLEGKVAIITGGTSGIGAGTAIKFAEEGAKVVIVGRNEQRGANVVKKIEALGSEGLFVKADMGVVADAEKIIRAAIERFGKLDILFSNAGMIVNVPFLEHTEEMYDEVMTVDLKMPFVLTQKALPYLLETKGCVIYTASEAGHRPANLTYLYNMSKSALIMMSQCLAAHYAEDGVRFNTVSPGLVDTPILGPIPDEIRDACADVIPAKRMGKVEEVANLVLFLASNDAPFINGADIIIDGAYHVRF